MNIQRFTAPTSREAMAKARNAFGDSAVILSSRSTEDGFEVMAAAEESLAQVAQSAARPMPIRTRANPGREALQMDEPDTVQGDTEQMAMSTLSFQEYVRERMLRKRRAAMGGEGASVQAPAAPVVAPRARVAPEQIQVPVQRFNAPVAAPMPAPIRTRSAAPAWEDSMPSQPPVYHDGANVAVELSALKEMIEERFNTLAWLGQARQNPIQSTLMLKLIRAGYSPALSRAVLEHLPEHLGAQDAVRWLMEVLERNLRTDAQTLPLYEEGGIFAMVGATGVGKTTTTAKLAALCARIHGPASVGLITLDTYRVGAHEQLRSYGRMLGVVAHLAHDRAALQDLLGLLAGKKMVLIDTAGMAQRDSRTAELLDMLAHRSLRKILVLNAAQQGETIEDVAQAWRAQDCKGVVLSKIDEAVKLGPALDAMIRHKLKVLGVTNGQRVPEDIHAAHAELLIDRALRAAQLASPFNPESDEMAMLNAAQSGWLS